MKAIMLMFDSLNRKMLSPYGCDWTVTPNFQRLAKHSVQFQNQYAGSLPCIPARRELHTGRYNFLHRSWGPMEPFDDSMPEILKNHGIHTHLISDHTHYWEDGGATYHTRYSSWQYERGQEGDPWKVLPELIEGTGTVQNKDAEYFQITGKMHRQDAVNRKFCREEAATPLARTFADGLEFINNNYAADQWFLHLECFDPHEPFCSPESYQALYADDYDGPLFDWPPYHHVTENKSTAEHLKKQYAALLTMCDTYLGKLLDCMDEHQMWEDTLLIVNTDHGYLLGEHGWWSKGCMPWYDELVHIPLFIHDPRFMQMDGQIRDQIVQTIDLPATLLEFFEIGIPRDMQGIPIRKVIEEDQAIRNYALFGVHGGHVNIFDGRYVYMKAPVSQENGPLFEYTLMPAHMRSLFFTSELKLAQLAPPFPFTKECPVLKISKQNGISEDDFGDLLTGKGDPVRSGHIDNNSLTNSANFGDKLFDMKRDPGQLEELEDLTAETAMANLLIDAMRQNDAPKEQYLRLGLKESGGMTRKEVQQMHDRAVLDSEPYILTEYTWSRAAVNAYRALMKFVKAEKRIEAAERIEKILLDHLPDRNVTYDHVLNTIPAVIEEKDCDMIYYFVSLAGRAS